MRWKKRLVWLLGGMVIGFSYFGMAQNSSPSPYGINVHRRPNTVLAKVKNAGIKWIRTGVHWYEIEKTKGTMDWTQIDRVVNYAAANDLSVLFLISGTPNWANTNQGPNYPAKNVEDWRRFIRAAVNRYKNRVKYWSLWNEPNLKRFFALGKDVFVSKIFLPAAQTLKTNSPDSLIVGPELAHLTSENQEWYFWLKYILSEAGHRLDIISHHIYKDEGVYYIYELLTQGDNFIPAVKKIIDESGHGNKPFWITETGWNTKDVSDAVQAERYLQMLQKRRQMDYPHKLFFYEIQDDESSSELPWGILRTNLAEKPAYGIYKDFIAGKYPIDNDDNDSDHDDSKKCYLENMSREQSSAASEKTIDKLRDFRDQLKHFSPACQKVVQMYYRHNQEVTTIINQDARLFTISREFFNALLLQINQITGIHSHQRIHPPLIQHGLRFIRELQKKSLSEDLRKQMLWLEKQLLILQEKSPSDYLFNHFHEQIISLSD
jgi:hypothetical protein